MLKHTTSDSYINFVLCLCIPSFRVPLGVPNNRELLAFLGSDYNPELTATARPSTPAPLGCVLAGTAGSGGMNMNICIFVCYIVFDMAVFKSFSVPSTLIKYE